MKILNKETPLNRKYLGADTLISPEVIALLKAVDNEQHKKSAIPTHAVLKDYEYELGL